MKVFKFGGASVKDASAVKNVASIVSECQDKLGVVVSAMGKTTNAMEDIVRQLCDRNESQFVKLVEERRSYHLEILRELFENEEHEVFRDVNQEFDELLGKYTDRVPDNFNFEYDQIVSIGEIVSTKIISAFLQKASIKVSWTDSREIIRTDHNYREAEVDWERTTELFNEKVTPLFQENDVLVMQGFIGHTDEGFTTTLGREGSDFTASIMAYCCDAESVTIWKDVPGMLNADPKWFEDTIKLEKISFKEAIELSYYGASVIHPKTVKPLQNKKIPLYVKSFIEPDKDGTIIQASTSNDHLVPSFIFKLDQVLFSITPKDFSFLVEKNLSDIFDRIARVNAKINVMQNSALNFSFLVDQDKVDIQKVVDVFKDHYIIKFNDGLELITIRHYDNATIERVTENKEILLEQKTRETARLVVKDQ